MPRRTVRAARTARASGHHENHQLTRPSPCAPCRFANNALFPARGTRS
jgi:hypothetical protein